MNLLKNKTQKEKLIILVLTITLIASVLFIFISKKQQNSLQVYMNENSVNVWGNTDSNNLNISMKSYVYDDLKIGFYVPKEWIESKMESGTKFLHKESGSEFELIIKEYEPTINNVSSSTVSTALVEDGYAFLNFTRLSANSYQVLYQEKTNTINDYIDTVFWDRTHIVTLRCSFNDINYQGIIPYFDKIISSFKWAYENPIPDGCAIYYNENLKFEIAVPASWVANITQNAIQFVNSSTNATAVISISNHTKYFDDFTATDMTNLIKNGQTGLMLKDFTKSHTSAYALYTYVLNNKQVTCDYYVITDGKYNYYISLTYYTGTMDSSAAKTMAESLKSYN